MEDEQSYRAHGPDIYGFLAVGLGDPMPFPFGGVMYGNTLGLLAYCGPGADAADTHISQRNSYTLSAAIEGASLEHTAVAGISSNAAGVFGQTEAPADVPSGFLAGVVGAADTQPGVIGYSKSGDAVQGASFTGTAVHGYSFFGSAVSGLSGGNGPPVPKTINIAGV